MCSQRLCRASSECLYVTNRENRLAVIIMILEFEKYEPLEMLCFKRSFRDNHNKVTKALTK
jgi:hypothetical protein